MLHAEPTSARVEPHRKAGRLLVPLARGSRASVGRQALTYSTGAKLINADDLCEGFPSEGAQDQAAHRRRVAAHGVAELARAIQDQGGARVHDAPASGTRRHGQVVHAR